MKIRFMFMLLLSIALVTGCDSIEEAVTGEAVDEYRLDDVPAATETGTVVRVVDGDTIEVRIDGEIFDIRYIGVNTPERDEDCYQAATNANRDLVGGQEVQLVRDVSNTDRFGRLLRYVFVDDVFVGATLVQSGYAEVVSYPPDNRYFDLLDNLEDEATDANRGCHPTGIFDDNSRTR